MSGTGTQAHTPGISIPQKNQPHLALEALSSDARIVRSCLQRPPRPRSGLCTPPGRATPGERLARMIAIAGSLGVGAEHAGLLGIFGGIAVVLVAFGAMLWAVSGRIIGWMHGADAVRRA